MSPSPCSYIDLKSYSDDDDDDDDDLMMMNGCVQVLRDFVPGTM